MTNRLCILTVALLLGAASLRCLASPMSPVEPSTYNFQSLNEIAVPTTDSDWNFELSHLDMCIASSHLSGLRSHNTTMLCLQYMLYHTVLVSDTTEQTALANYAAANGYDVESAFLHYYDDTTYTLNGTTYTIPGYGGGSATSLQQARVKTNIWGSDRYVYNIKSPLFQKFKANYYSQILDSGDKPDGIMVDETSPMSGYVPTPTTGGEIIEYNNETVSQASTAYMSDMITAFGQTDQLMNQLMVQLTGGNSAFGNWPIIPNVAEYVDDFINLGLNGTDGLLTEMYVQEIQPRAPDLYNVAKQLADAGKYFIIAQASYAPMVTNAPSNYYSDMDRHQMYALTEYWIAKQGKYTYYEQKAPSDYELLSQFWCNARDYDVGQPVDSMYSIWQTGTDSAGQNYTIYKRQYTKALMLARPQQGWPSSPQYNVPSQTYPLGGTYQLLHSDGTLGPDITSIALCMGEDATLIPVSTTSSTGPTISGITASSLTSNSAAISWSTNVQTTGVVNYGTTTSYGSSASASTLAASQNVALSSLSAGTTYHYQIVATDSSGNKTTSADNTFTTAAATASPQISVSISANKTSAASGDSIIYTVTCQNIGSGSATVVAVSADVDPNVTFVSASNSGAYDSTANVVRWSLGSLAPGASTSMTYTVTVK